MGKLLFVNACVRNNESRTLKLCRHALGQLSARYSINEVTLADEKLLPLSVSEITEREEMVMSGATTAAELRLALMLKEADYVVIGAPYWDLSFPASLKLFIERVNVSNLTFRYTDDGRPQGLCHAKGLLYITTAGGIVGNNNFGYEYVKAVFGILGITNCHCETCDMLDIFGVDTQTRIDESMRRLTDYIKEYNL